MTILQMKKKLKADVDLYRRILATSPRNRRYREAFHKSEFALYILNQITEES
jgi:hypothetical protein